MLKPLEYLELIQRRLWLIKVMSLFPRLTWLGMQLTRPLYVDHETWLNRTLRYGMMTLGAGKLPPEEVKAYIEGFNAMSKNFKRAMNARRDGVPLVWVQWILSSEIIAAFGARALNAELLNVFGNVAGWEAPPKLIAEAEAIGVPVEYCSALKLSIGAYILGQTPEPDLIIRASQPCDTSISSYQIMEYLTGAPSFTFDAPYWKDEASFDYYEKVMWDFIAFMEHHLKRSIDWEKLREILTTVNEFNFYLHEVTEMMRATPCPCSMITLLMQWVMREITIGDPAITASAKAIYEIVRRRYEKGEGIVRKEKIRVIWWNPPFAFFTYVFKWMEHTFGAVVVNDFIGQCQMPQIDTSSNEAMVRGLAESHLYLAMGRQCHGPVEFITDELKRAFEAYSADCIIFAGHNGCQHGWAVGRIFKDICKKAKLPVLILNADIMDQRHMPEKEIMREITEFFRSTGLA
ncbi:MAG TPA: 2-hydroxyacyl-CoA dehydratase family protein [Deltaproteobacteria bacterium]|nr:2-hydroxyacyl-CoA dehydratase family protein [Deltaproteobacteria bacterium]